MAINLYSKDSVDTLLAAKLSDAPSDGSTYGRKDGAWEVISESGLTISTLSNGAASTLNASVPSAEQVLVFDGTDLAWHYQTVLWGSIGGTLSSQTDLQTELDLKANLSAPSFTSGISVDGTGITFSDSTIQTTAAIAGVNLGDVFSVANVKSVAFTGTYPSPGQWQIDFKAINQYFAASVPIYVENADGSISQDVKGSASTSSDWSYTTTTDTFPGDAYLYLVVNGVKSTMPINNP